MEHQITLHYSTYENWRETLAIPNGIAEQLEALLISAYAPTLTIQYQASSSWNQGQ